jgi:hypothetical protein
VIIDIVFSGGWNLGSALCGPTAEDQCTYNNEYSQVNGVNVPRFAGPGNGDDPYVVGFIVKFQGTEPCVLAQSNTCKNEANALTLFTLASDTLCGCASVR